MNKDSLKTLLCTSSWEPARFRFGLVTGRLSGDHSTPRPLTLFTPAEWEKTSTKHETDHRMDRNSGPAATQSFGMKEMGPSLRPDPPTAALSPK